MTGNNSRNIDNIKSHQDNRKILDLTESYNGSKIKNIKLAPLDNKLAVAQRRKSHQNYFQTAVTADTKNTIDDVQVLDPKVLYSNFATV